MPSFDPDPYDTLTLFGEEFVVQVHPKLSEMAYAQEGGRATIFQLRDRMGGRHALKVFKPSFLEPGQSEIAERLARYCALPGMRAAQRRVVRAHDRRTPSSLDHAVMMAWIHGTTWYDVLSQAKARGDHLHVGAAVRLCQRFLEVLRSLEACGAAHTDISAGNVVIDLASLDVQLVDLEELFGPGFPPPGTLTRRTAGYSRDTFSRVNSWSGAADRFAGAVLAAEILALSSPDLAPTSRGDSFFDPATIGAPDAAHYRAVVDHLRGWAPEFAALFERAWSAVDLTDCATIAECSRCIDALAARTPLPAGDRLVVPERTVVAEDDARLTTTVTWVNLFDDEPVPVPHTPPPPGLAPTPNPPSIAVPPLVRPRSDAWAFVIAVVVGAILLAALAITSHYRASKKISSATATSTTAMVRRTVVRHRFISQIIASADNLPLAPVSRWTSDGTSVGRPRSSRSTVRGNA